jgi:hypothetical protein
VTATHSVGLALEGVGGINRVKDGAGKGDGNFCVATVETKSVRGQLGWALDGNGLRFQLIWNRASLINRIARQGCSEGLGGRPRGGEAE